ncbi:DUF6088 family protein [Sphingopyxis sp.]|uniref:DUF6088 family protein n=1 Tax=Sphingopyxis sp. TaxID=1908224 RepID=UPI0025F42930|nr:DUF6088 family protein [Sphingopyxis sp.]
MTVRFFIVRDLRFCQNYVYTFLTKGNDMRGPGIDLKDSITVRMATCSPFGVWVPADFADLGPRDAVDQVLHRLVRAGRIRRITRGLYDKPNLNALTGKSTHPDPRSVIDALARRDSARMIVDGITAANDIGLSDAVPAHIVVHTDARLKSLALGNLTIHFKKTAPSKLFWAGRPAMRIVQALHWLRDTLDSDAPRVRKRLQSIFADPVHGSAITADLRDGLSTLPIWMQFFLRDLIAAPDGLPNMDAAISAPRSAIR